MRAWILMVVGVVGGLGLTGGQAAGQTQSESDSSEQRGLYAPPTPDEIPAPALPAQTLERVGKAVVLIERVDAQGRQLGPACAFVDSRGYVLTNRHCIEGATAIKLNLGADGMFDLPTLVFENELLDVVALKGDFPIEKTGRLEWAGAPPHEHSPVAVVMRDRTGLLGSSPGWSGACDFEPSGNLVLCASAPAWLGCSGSPLVDAEGRVVGVVSRLGDPVAGQVRTSAQASVCTDVLALATDAPKPMAEWSVTAWGSNYQQYQRYRTGVDQWAAKDPVRALGYAETGLTLKPGDTRMTFYRVHLLYRLHRESEAEAAIAACMVEHPDDPLPPVIKGHQAFRARDYVKAIDAYKASLKVKPTAMVWYWRGSAEWALHDYQAAAASYEECLRLEPRHTRSWEALIRMYEALNRPEECVRIHERRLAADSKNPELLAALASAKLQVGKKSEHSALIEALRPVSPYLANRAEIPPMNWSDYYK